jgi:hypothetical protein
MIKFIITFRYIALLATLLLLSGCLGGSIASSIASSIATRVADKAVARAMDVDEDQPYSNRSTSSTQPQNTIPQSMMPQSATLQGANPQTAKPAATEVDDYTYAVATFAFEPVKPVAEPLPEQTEAIDTPIQVVQSSQLVRVELFNLLIGDEKNAVYEQARLMGASSLPQKREWQNWGVGVGVVEHSKKVITFLIPPEFGKLPSGAVAIVELASSGELNVARYKPNNLRYQQTLGFEQAAAHGN